MKKENKNLKAKIIRKKSKKRAVFMLAAITTIIWLILIFVKIVYSSRTGGSIDFWNILDSIIDNLLGILPPIILIDFAFEAVTQDYVSEEISEQITSTLMSNPETIALFDNDAKRSFLNTTIATITPHGKDEANMAMGAIAPYIESKFNLRKHFDYNISLWNYPSPSILNHQDYMMVSETLRYEKQFISTNILPSTFKIGFFTQNTDLDKHLRKNEYLVRESLVIYPDDLEKLIHLSDEEKIAFVKDEMALKAFIDHGLCTITDVSITEIGIDVTLFSTHNLNSNTIYVDVAFCMPQKKDNAVFLVAVTEPTYEVDVRLTYARNEYKVQMYPFFNDLDDALVDEVDRGVGTCDIHIRDKWVYPMSGIVFTITSL